MIEIEELRKCKILKELNDRELETISNIIKVETYDCGIRIFEEKALAINLYLVMNGKVEIKLKGNGRAPISIDKIGPGDIFGWSAAIDPYTFTASAYTMEKTKLAIIDGEQLRKLFENNNHIGYRIIKEISVVISRRLKACEARFVEYLNNRN